MKNCLREPKACIGRDCRDIKVNGVASLCCREEIMEEQSLVQSIVDSIDDCSKDINSLQKISSKLSFAAHIINHNGNEELIEILPILKRFSLLMYEYKETIVDDCTTGNLFCSFIQEVKKWLTDSFLVEYSFNNSLTQRASMISDITTIEMTLGVCMIDEYSDSIDDLFF